MQKGEYNYDYKFSFSGVQRQIIMLSINDVGEPDYKYMEQYIKNTFIKKILRIY